MKFANYFIYINISELFKIFFPDAESLSTKSTRIKYLISIAESLKFYLNHLFYM